MNTTTLAIQSDSHFQGKIFFHFFFWNRNTFKNRKGKLATELICCWQIDPLGRPPVIASGDYYLHTPCPSVPTFQNHATLKQITNENSDRHWRNYWGSGRGDHWWQCLVLLGFNFEWISIAALAEIFQKFCFLQVFLDVF